MSNNPVQNSEISVASSATDCSNPIGEGKSFEGTDNTSRKTNAENNGNLKNNEIRKNGNDGPGHSSGSGIDGSGPSSSNNSSATIRQNKPSDSKAGAKAGRGNGSLYASGFLRAGGMKDSDRKSVQFSSEPGKTAGVGEEDPVPDPKDLILVSRADLSQIVATHFKESLEAFSSKKKRGSITLGTPSKRKSRKTKKAAILSPAGITHQHPVNLEIEGEASEEEDSRAAATPTAPPNKAVMWTEPAEAVVRLGPQLNYQSSPGIKCADLLERTILSTSRILISGFPGGFTADDVRREVNFLLAAEQWEFNEDFLESLLKCGEGYKLLNFNNPRGTFCIMLKLNHSVEFSGSPMVGRGRHFPSISVRSGPPHAVGTSSRTWSAPYYIQGLPKDMELHVLQRATQCGIARSPAETEGLMSAQLAAIKDKLKTTISTTFLVVALRHEALVAWYQTDEQGAIVPTSSNPKRSWFQPIFLVLAFQGRGNTSPKEVRAALQLHPSVRGTQHFSWGGGSSGRPCTT